MKALSEATTGTKWLDTTGWNPIINNATCPQGYDISDALGISVNERYRVDSISLRDNGLKGELPFAWRGLEYTTSINLSKNLLEGEIPTDLGSMNNLKDLRLHHNKRLSSPGLTGDIPVETWNFDSLEVLSLGQNALTGGIPEGLGEKANLRELWLEQNQLGGSIPASLGHLKDLTVLRINQNGMSGCFPTNLLHLCGQLTNYNINGGNNNFDDTYINLCNSNSGLCSDCTETDILWSGAISDQWDNPLNWEYGCLPQSNGRVTIGYGESSVIPSSFTDTIMSMKVNNPTTEFRISSGAKLFIRNAGKPLGIIEAIENEGIIINNGELTIDSSYSNAILNRERIENNGLLEILNSSKRAVENNKTLINNNSILISQVEKEAIYNRDSIHNSLTGTITIDNVLTSDGIENFGFTQDSAILVNYGNIMISDVADGDGLKSNYLSAIENKGDINIMDVDGDGIESRGRLSNESLIEISNITGNYGIDASNRSNQQPTFYNHSSGNITIENAGTSAGLTFQGSALNEGSITITSSLRDGLQIEYGGKLVNSGTITISDSSEKGLDLSSESLYINQSLGKLIISNSTKHGIFMLSNATLMNLENGKITVSNTTETPIEIKTGAVLEGYPTIEIND